MKILSGRCSNGQGIEASSGVCRTCKEGEGIEFYSGKCLKCHGGQIINPETSKCICSNKQRFDPNVHECVQLHKSILR